MAASSDPTIIADANEAAVAVAHALNELGYETDFSIDSLREVERFFLESTSPGTANPSGLFPQRLAPRPFAIGPRLGEVIRKYTVDDSASRAEENFDLLGSQLFAIGAYVGEVIRRECSARWEGSDSDPLTEWSIALELPNNRVIWPVHRIIARFLNGPGDNVYHYGALIVDLSKRPSGNSEK